MEFTNPLQGAILPDSLEKLTTLLRYMISNAEEIFEVQACMYEQDVRQSSALRPSLRAALPRNRTAGREGRSTLDWVYVCTSAWSLRIKRARQGHSVGG